MPSFKLPEVNQCCCIADLKTAATVIAVLAIVTSPAISWSVIRHSYVIRVSCFISSSAEKSDVVDISLNNIISFGFGTNAGLGPTCLKTKPEDTKPEKSSLSGDLRIGAFADASSGFITLVKTFGTIVLVFDLIFVLTSINFLIKIAKGTPLHAAKVFMITTLIVTILSFIYGMLYVSACISMGGAFPMFEFFFIFFDAFLWIMWIYFVLVLHSYIKQIELQFSHPQQSTVATFMGHVKMYTPAFVQTIARTFTGWLYSHYTGILSYFSTAYNYVHNLFARLFRYEMF